MDTHYTPQQLTGGPSYNPRVRIGNWNEDIHLEEAKLQGAIDGTVLTRMRHKLKNHLQPMQLSELEDDGFVRFGSTLILYSENTRGFISVDLDTQLNKGYGITTAKSEYPCARMCFLVEHVPSQDDIFYNIKENERNVLHYGQHIRLRLCSELSEIPLFLRSEFATPTIYARKVTNAQEVSVDARCNASTVWKVEHADQQFALEWDGEPVRSNYPMVLRHVSTNSKLSAEAGAVVLNDFGVPENIVCGRHDRRNPKRNLFCMVLQDNESKREENGEEKEEKHKNNDNAE